MRLLYHLTINPHFTVEAVIIAHNPFETGIA
jgi:hypothetical protein